MTRCATPPSRSVGMPRFALTLTGTLVLTALGLAADIVAWQCTAPGGACRTDGGTDPGWLRVFAADWMVPAERWWLGRWTWVKHERTAVPEPDGAVSGASLRLGARKLWNGAEAVGRLRALHVAAGFAVIALVITWPSAAGGPATVVIVAAAVVLVAVVALVAVHSVAARVDPDVPEVRMRGLDKACTAVRWGALAVYALVLALAAFDALGPEPDPEPSLPGFTGTIAGLYLARWACSCCCSSSSARSR
jgi:hypothetical protein